jgi:hypothetical protein
VIHPSILFASREKMSAPVAVARRRGEHRHNGEITMSEFILLYRSEATSRAGSTPAEMQQVMQKWVTWMKALGEKGAIKDPGQPLEMTGKVVDGKRAVTDGPYAESKDLVCGFTIVEAKDVAHAVELSAGCPIFDVGGLVEVRPVAKMNR